TCLVTMIANLTLGRPKYAAVQEPMRGLAREAARLRTELLSLGRRDSEAFEAVLRARRLPESTAEEQAARATALARAALEADCVPLATAEACLGVLELATRAAREGNPQAVSDAGVAGSLAAAA